jgi:predicted GNAT family N-acyltransferase
MQVSQLDFQILSWIKNLNEIKKIRTVVFLHEQNIPEELEWDEYDKTALHFGLFYKSCLVAYARSIENNVYWIGRMAVQKEYRNISIGSHLLQLVIAFLRDRNSQKDIFVSAQVQAIHFYEKNNFSVRRKTYLDAGILHTDMILRR